MMGQQMLHTLLGPVDISDESSDLEALQFIGKVARLCFKQFAVHVWS